MVNMRILILNWRDIKNPSSGGAEILTHEIARRWVKEGHLVTQFSSEFPNCLVNEVIDGVQIIRKGHPDARHLFESVHFQAFLYYMINFRGKIDIVIDEIHGLPFFTPLYVKEKKIALICEVADELWQKFYGPFFGTMGKLIEIVYLRFIYKNVLYLTISQSTKSDLVEHGVTEKNITVLPMGITVTSNIKTTKEKNPTLLYVGRLSKSKGIEDAVLTVKNLISEIPDLKLFIVGRGDKDYRLHLKYLVRKLNLSNHVKLLGFVSEKNKFELMANCHILLAPSIKEGFGLTIPEAGSVGTPAIVYNAPGLSDLIKDKKSGIICRENNPYELARNIKLILTNKKLYDGLSKGAYRESKRYNWDNTAKVALSILKM